VSPTVARNELLERSQRQDESIDEWMLALKQLAGPAKLEKLTPDSYILDHVIKNAKDKKVKCEPLVAAAKKGERELG
jgi:uncharacterized protein YjgD (DUF1641 family)